MRKLPKKLDSPIDDIFLQLVENTEEIFKRYDFTPNMITIISIGVYFCALFAWLYGEMVLFFFFYWVAFYFDCLDGFYARKYNQVTILGDYLDHVKDTIITLLTVAYIVYKLFFLNYLYLILFLMITYISSINVSSTEKYLFMKDKSNSQSLAFMMAYNPIKLNEKIEDVEAVIYKTKLFGCGTAVAITSVLLMIL